MYINKESRKAIEESAANLKKYDELVYVVTVFALKMWNAAPNDNTVAILTKELVVDPKNSRFVNDMRNLLCGELTVADIYTACRLAYDEFYQRIVRLHRAVQCRENGDIEGYQVAMKPLLEKLGQEVKKEVASHIIIPAK